MNGIHDLGGMDGFTLPVRDQGRILEQEWERLVWGMTFALFGVPGLPRGGRRVIERIPPDLYLGMPYYARWLYAREKALLDSGLVTEAELADPEGPISMPDLPGFQAAAPADVLAFVSADASAELDVNAAAPFAVGDTVRAKNEHPAGHTRMPRYVRGHEGTIHKHHGVHEFQDELPPGIEAGPQNLYTVMFAAPELWGGRGHVKDRIFVELWDYHLEAVAQTDLE